MSTTKQASEMTAEELLEQLPRVLTKDWLRCAVNDPEKFELMRRLVLSFGPMREALQSVVNTIESEEINPSVTLRRYVRQCKKALALADGKKP